MSYSLAYTQSELYVEHEINFLKKMVDRKKVNPPEPLISKWIEGRRSYPPNSPFPGPHRNSRTPYVTELMDNMSPYSPIIYTDTMKGGQLGVTSAAENVLGYYTGENPADQLYVSSTEDMLEKWSKRYDAMIDSCGLRSLITSTANNPKSRKTGDKTFSKTFFGGSLNMASAQSSSSLQSETIRILILDEVDHAPAMLRGGAGKFTKNAEMRTVTWNLRRKIMSQSTPKTYDISEIYQRYLLGDRRQFLVPCPYCGKKQWLDHDATDNFKHGLRGETKGGILVNSYYLCDFCHEAIFNHHKGHMLANGSWEPTTQSTDPLRRSYQISSLYSPVGMLSWTSYFKEYQEAMDTPDGMRAFTNLYQGMPYRETGAKPLLQNVIELRGIYNAGFVPDGVLFLTIGLDVQRGSDKGDDNPARLEFEVLGHGLGYKTWSIDYQVILGATNDPSAGAWAKLQEFAENGGLLFKNLAGREFSPMLMFFDANDPHSTSAVYEFTAGWKNAIPIRGAGQLNKKKTEKADQIDEQKQSNVKRFRWIKADNDINVVMISTAYYKNIIYRRLKISRVDGDDQKPGYCDFPMSYPDVYYKGLTAEERLIDGSFRCPSGKRNEPLDCRVYAMAAGDVFIDARINDLRAVAKRKGAKDHVIQAINSKTVLMMLKQAIG